MNKLFLSCVTREFGAYRALLTKDLRRAKVELRVEEDFGVAGVTLLDALDGYIRECDAVVHLIGDGSGAIPEVLPVRALLARYPAMTSKVPVLAGVLSQPDPRISYTQWEAYLAIYHGREIHIYVPSSSAPRGAGFTAGDEERRSQEQHLKRISDLGWHRGPFENEQRLSAYVLADLRHILGPDPEPFLAAPTKLPKRHDSGVFEGREKILADLDALWADALAEKAGRAQIVSLVAIGGAGKTTVASRWKDTVLAREDHGEVERYFDWSFYSQGTRREGDNASAQTTADATVFIAVALKFFGDPATADSAAPAWDKGVRLAALVAQHRTLLILDGLEPLQHPPGPQTGELKDDAIRALFAGLQNSGTGLCVVTTREPIADLVATRETTTPERRLDHLSEIAGALVLKRHGVTGPEHELRQASAEVKGHALTLTLMGRYLALAFHPPDVARRDCFRFAEVNPEVQNGHAFRVFEEYEQWFEREARHVELAILRLLGLFDRPATPDCIAALCAAPVIPGLTDPLVGLGERPWNAALNRLLELDLIEAIEWTPTIVSGYAEADAHAVWEAGRRGLGGNLGSPDLYESQSSVFLHTSIDAHPLLREYFDVRLKLCGSAPAAHARLYDHLCASVPYWPEGRDGLLPLYQAVAHGCKAGLYQQVCDDVYRDRINRGTTGFYLRYSGDKLGLIGLDLAAVGCFFVEPWRRLATGLTIDAEAWLINEAAFSLRGLNRLAESLQSMREGMERDVRRQDWHNAAISAGNLSELELILGDLAAADAIGAQSVIFADRGKRPFDRLSKRALQAWALCQSGRLEESYALFAQAEKMLAEDTPRFPLLYSMPGFQYCDGLLVATERAVWRNLAGFQSGGPLVVSSRDLSSELEAETTALKFDLAAVERRAVQTLEWGSSHNYLLDIALDHLTLGRVNLLRSMIQTPGLEMVSSLSRAREYLDIALATLRQANTSDHLPRALLPFAWLHVLRDEPDIARQRLNESFALATRGANPKKNWEGGMRLHLIDTLLHRARLFARRDPYPWEGRTPRVDLEEAAKLIEVCGYHRRDEELADAMAAIPG